MPKTRHPNTNLHPHPHRPPIPHPISPPKTPPSRPKPTQSLIQISLYQHRPPNPPHPRPHTRLPRHLGQIRKHALRRRHTLRPLPHHLPPRREPNTLVPFHRLTDQCLYRSLYPDPDISYLHLHPNPNLNSNPKIKRRPLILPPTCTLHPLRRKNVHKRRSIRPRTHPRSNHHRRCPIRHLYPIPIPIPLPLRSSS